VNVDRSSSSLSGIGGAIGSGSYYPPLDPQFAAIVAQKERLEAEMKDLKALLAQANSQNIPNKKFVNDEEEVERIRRENVETTKALTSLKQLLEQKDERSKKEKQIRRQYDKQLQEHEKKLQTTMEENSALTRKTQEMESMLQQGMVHITQQQQGLMNLGHQQLVDEEELSRLRREHRWLLNENQYLKRLFKERGLAFDIDPNMMQEQPMSQRSSYDQQFRASTTSSETPSMISMMRKASRGSLTSSGGYSSRTSSSLSIRNVTSADLTESVDQPYVPLQESVAITVPVIESKEIKDHYVPPKVEQKSPKTPEKKPSSLLTVETNNSNDSLFNKNPIVTPQSARNVERHTAKENTESTTAPVQHARQPKEKPRRQVNVELPEFNALNNDGGGNRPANTTQTNNNSALTKPNNSDLNTTVPRRRGDKGFSETALPQPQVSPELAFQQPTLRQDSISPAPPKQMKPKRKGTTVQQEEESTENKLEEPEHNTAAPISTEKKEDIPHTEETAHTEHKEVEHKEVEGKEAEHKDVKEVEHKEAEHKEVEHKEVKEVEHKEVEHKEAEHKEVEHKEVEHKEAEHKEVEHKEAEHKEAEHKAVEPEKAKKTEKKEESKEPVAAHEEKKEHTKAPEQSTTQPNQTTPPVEPVVENQEGTEPKQDTRRPVQPTEHVAHVTPHTTETTNTSNPTQQTIEPNHVIADQPKK
jgi:hypothetical protein